MNAYGTCSSPVTSTTAGSLASSGDALGAKQPALPVRLETRLDELGARIPEEFDAAGNIELKTELKEGEKEVKGQVKALRRELEPPREY